MIDTKALRSRVLDLAIQGKLTEQLESDGSAEELWQKIQAEKQEIIASGVLKGKKKICIRQIEDNPFDIPSNWRWIRLGDVSEVFGRIGFRGYTKNDIVSEGEGALSLSPSNITISGDIVFEKCTYITWEKYEESPEIQIKTGDILIVKTGSSYGKCCVADTLPCKATINPQLAVLKYVLCNRTYLKYALNSIFVQQQFESFVIGAATPTFSQENLANVLLPLPPLAEQKRIVARVEEIFRLLDIIDAAQEQYAADAESLKAKLITLGIQGRLTEQLESDGTAEELYQQIQAEKQRLIKEGRIKREKPLPEISDDEIPFEIPENWKWCRLSDVIDVRDGTHDSPKYHKEGIPLITSKNLSSGKLDFDNTNLISIEDAKKINERSCVEIGDILFAMIGTIGNPVIVNDDREFCIKNVALFKQYKGVELNIKYLYFYLLREQYELKKITIGGLQPFVSLKMFRMHLIPLPPLAEQKRIAETLERVLGVLG